MIFPLLRGFVSIGLAPLTYLLLTLNLLVFTVTFDAFEVADRQLDELLSDKTFINTQGWAFASMIHETPDSFSVVLQKLANKVLVGDEASRKILGSFAFRNAEFMSKAETYEFAGDDVALGQWRSKLKDLQKIKALHPSYAWGLSHDKNAWLQYVTYQFSHNGFLHLFWNMAFLLLFGCFIEVNLGSSFVIITYLGSGLIGAGTYFFLSGLSATPLVGASAAVSGLMALVGVGWLGRENLNYFYWLLPIHGYFGVTLLPSWLLILVSLLPDVSGYMGASSEFGSVAYTAHLGGAVFGALVALLWRSGLMVKEIEDPKADLETDENPSDHRRAG